jgi:hypothetical protein
MVSKLKTMIETANNKSREAEEQTVCRERRHDES